MQEVQLTSGRYGHMLNSAQVFSPDDQWVVYDTRNDQTHIGRTCCIEKVNIRTGEIVRLYTTAGQTIHGPGVGAVAFHPLKDRMIFIHGLTNCDEENPYGFTRRFGAILNEQDPGVISHAEARSISGPLVPGALRGGTHAHSWSGDGEWISFTYNDWLMEKQEQVNPDSKDLRTIGVMAPVKQVTLAEETAENFSGQYFTVVVATVTETPAAGSDEVEKALDECWVGKNGYDKKDGAHQRRAIAFQGIVRVKDGSPLTEVFVSDIPDDVTHAAPGQTLEGTLTTRPTVPLGVVQRRVTFTDRRKFPGVQGPRFWLRSAPDGARIYFLMKDDNGIVQLYEVPTNGGEIRQVTELESSIQAQFNISPDGKSVAFICDNSIWITDIRTGVSRRITVRTSDDQAPVLTVVWDHAGNALVYNRYQTTDDGRYLQIFRILLN
ncbi:MAG: DUF3748 domain-containing protein [Chryseosolibacter sp.]